MFGIGRNKEKKQRPPRLPSDVDPDRNIIGSSGAIDIEGDTIDPSTFPPMLAE